jgi:hypothetical protein
LDFSVPKQLVRSEEKMVLRRAVLNASDSSSIIYVSLACEDFFSKLQNSAIPRFVRHLADSES